MKLAKAILFVLCLNLASWMVTEMNVTGSEGLTPFNAPSTAETMQQEVIAQIGANPQNLVSLMTGYVWPALQFIWRLFSGVFFGFPQILDMLERVYGLPSIISIPLKVLWAAIWAIAIAEWIRGMRMSD